MNQVSTSTIYHTQVFATGPGGGNPCPVVLQADNISAARGPDDGSQFAARQFPNQAGYDEDPATGVAACALAAYLTRYLSQEDGWHSYEIQQGQAMGRPSLLTAQARMRGGRVINTRVSGEADILSQERATFAG